MAEQGSGAGSIFDLTGRVAVVTGGNRGIGLGIAEGLARAGATISIWGRDAARNAEAVSRLESLGAIAAATTCDVSNEDSVVDARVRTLDRFGRVDVGVANAGFGRMMRPLDASLEDWRTLLATNLDGAFLTFRELGRHMVERGGGGKLIAVSSMVELFGAPAQPHYAASKGGLGAMVRSFAVALARYDVQVNAIQPGWVATEALDPLTADENAARVILARTPARRFGEPRDLEGIAVYLASDASRFHTGDSIRIDGGYAVF